MKEAELRVMADMCIFKVAAISGFTLTTADDFANVLRDEFLIFLNEFGYSCLTFEEIVTAFRLNAYGNIKTYYGDYIPQVKPYSSFFNLNYAGEVLGNYMNLRKGLDSRIINNERIDEYRIDNHTKTL